MSKPVKYSVLISCCAVLFSSPASADIDLSEMSLEQLMQVEISFASGFDQQIRKSPAALTVIYPEQWQARGIKRLDQLLETIPGFHVSPSQLALTMDVYGARGLQSGFNNRITLLINGQPLRGGNGGSTYFGFKKSLTGIKRVEIIKGPGSVVYGADAFSGVINLITEDANSPLQSAVTLSAGGFDSYGLEATHHIALADATLDVALSFQHNNDDKGRVVSSDLQSTIDQIFLTSASKAPGVINDRNKILDVSVVYSSDDLAISFWHIQNFDTGVGAGAAQVLDPYGKTTTTLDLLVFEQSFENVLGGQLNWSLAYQNYDSQSTYVIFPAGAVLPIGLDGNADFAAPVGFTFFSEGYLGNPGSQEEVWRTSFTHVSKLSEVLTLRSEIGFEASEATTKETKNFGPGILDGSQAFVDGSLTDVSGTEFIYRQSTSRDISHLSVQAEWMFSERWSLNLGARYDNYSDFGSTFNPRGGLIWTNDKQWTAKLIYGTAFRAPTHSELFFKNNPVATGNINLQEENISNTDLIIEWQPSEQWLVSLDLFDYEAEDLVEFVFDPVANQSIAQNVGNQKGRGGELLLTGKLSEDLQLIAHYSWVNVEFDNPANAKDYPQKQSYLAVDWTINDDWHLHGRYKRIADRMRGFGDARDDLKDYSLANIRLSYQGISDSTTVSLTINNAFDDDGAEPSPAVIAGDYLIHGRQFVVEIEQRF